MFESEFQIGNSGLELSLPSGVSPELIRTAVKVDEVGYASTRMKVTPVAAK